ncbi:MAG: PH domain-containing protein [Pseudomonadota bacterium]
MSEASLLTPGVAHRTKPIGLLIYAVGTLRQLVFPLVIAIFTLREGPMAQWIFGLGGLAIIASSLGFAYLRWTRRTFTIGEQDIRVESGIFSRTASSVPYERIQDVSLEQKLLARLLGLVSVKFETGAGGAEELSLAYLSQPEGEELRRLVRERRDEEAALTATSSSAQAAAAGDAIEQGTVLFSMNPRRLFIFGSFEFSLAVFAVLAGLTQYLDNFLDFEVWDVDVWRDLAQEQGGWLLELGAYSQAIGAILGLFAVALIGFGTGQVRTFAREWGFLLERTARGFRRRRGLFTRTDVVMPAHRVQGLTIGTRFIRYRFGWHSLRFVSLAQDAGAASHVVAPFAQMDELDPIVQAAGFHLPDEKAEWHRAQVAYRNVSMAFDALLFGFAAIIAGFVTAVYSPEWNRLAVSIPLVLGALDAVAGFVSWRFKRHALDESQIVAVSGILAPTTRIATRVKLHSVEIAQGPFGRRFGYATLHLGMAGGEMAIPGIPLERAKTVRAQVLETIAQTDFSQLESQRLPEAA